MGITERRQREKEDLKKSILEAAKKLFIEKGIEATSMRNIAELLEFSPTRLYIYFKDKNAIVYELHKEGFRLLGNLLHALSDVSNPMERLKAIGRIYLNFANEHSDFYEVMFVLSGPIEHVRQFAKDENWEEGTRVYQFLLETVNECLKKGYIKDVAIHQMTLLIWSTLHGIAMLHLHQHLNCIDFGDEVKQDDNRNALTLFDLFLKKMN